MFSVIIPLYNKQDTITKTLQSITDQDYNDYEVIVVDDGSTDESIKKVEDFHSSKIKIYKQPNRGVSAARNYGIEKAKGEWIVFLDADDTFEPDAFKHFEFLIDKGADYNIFCCNYYIDKNNLKYLYSNNYTDGKVRNNFFAWCSGMCMPRAGAAVYRRNTLLHYPFNEKLHRYEDADTIFAYMRKESIFRSSIPVMTYNCNSSTASLPCKDIKQDFIGNMQFEGKTFWEQYALFQLYKQGLDLYPNEMQQLYKLSIFMKIKFKFAAVLIGRMKKYHII